MDRYRVWVWIITELDYMLSDLGTYVVNRDAVHYRIAWRPVVEDEHNVNKFFALCLALEAVEKQFEERLTHVIVPVPVADVPPNPGN